MKKYVIYAALLFAATGTIASCGSEKKAAETDSASATVPDTTRSPTTHMDTSKKPPL